MSLALAIQCRGVETQTKALNTKMQLCRCESEKVASSASVDNDDDIPLSKLLCKGPALSGEAPSSKSSHLSNRCGQTRGEEQHVLIGWSRGWRGGRPGPGRPHFYRHRREQDSQQGETAQMTALRGNLSADRMHVFADQSQFSTQRVVVSI